MTGVLEEIAEMESAVAMTASDLLLCAASARLIGERTTKPESQKTGIPVT